MEKINFTATLIEASAGTGKTHALITAFMDRIDKRNPAASLDSMMAVTFSEKAAVEMKQRILAAVFADIWPRLSEEEKVTLENGLFRLRVSTIHSFCRYLLRRFAVHGGLDPFYTVIDEIETGLLFAQAAGTLLNSPRGEGRLRELAKEMKLRSIMGLLTETRGMHPHIFSGRPEDKPLTGRITALYNAVERIHRALKRSRSALDFDDLEKETYELLTENPQALLALEDFDERVSHLLVDEFQDTNYLQWEILRKLTEEWVSGFGARAERGGRFGLVLVGDRKQSIYRFRGAESDIFDRAGSTFAGWMREDRLTTSYRSTPEITGFVNELFAGTPPWDTQPLEALPGLFPPGNAPVEIHLSDDDPDKAREYDWICEKIISLTGGEPNLHDKGLKKTRPTAYRDIAILMRKRGRYLPLLEQALARRRIPYVLIGGIGFYQEDEILFLLSLLFALADPSDALSQWNLSRSAHRVTPEQTAAWRARAGAAALSLLFEEILAELDFWRRLNTQQRANVEKFLTLVQAQQHRPLFEAAQNMRKMCGRRDESKAGVFSERGNAVRLITVHGAKGLEFPVVFLANIEDGKVRTGEKIFYRRSGEEIPYSFVLSAEADPEYRKDFTAMLEAEEERVLYVAVTRAAQRLFISGIKKSGSLWIRRVAALQERYPSTETEGGAPSRPNPEPIEGPQDRPLDKLGTRPRPSVALPISAATGISSFSSEQDVSPPDRTSAAIGAILHRLLREISAGTLACERAVLLERAAFLASKEPAGTAERIRGKIETAVEKIIASDEIRRIAAPADNALAEVPFVTEKNGRLYRGIVDRALVNGDNISVYDYKTARGADPEIYREQLGLYAHAMRRIFNAKDIRSFLVFLNTGEVTEMENQ